MSNHFFLCGFDLPLKKGPGRPKSPPPAVQSFAPSLQPLTVTFLNQNECVPEQEYNKEFLRFGKLNEKTQGVLSQSRID